VDRLPLVHYRWFVAPETIAFPTGSTDEKTLLVQWLDYLRGAVLRNVAGLDDRQARWTPDQKLIPLLGIVQHLTNVEWRWIDGGFRGAEVSRSEREFHPGDEVRLDEVVTAYRQRAIATDATIGSLLLTQPSAPTSWAKGRDLRWVVLHLVNETARHAGHADTVRELLDGKTGE
jgi:uncharacterized damage-inducible protein DinB